MGWSAVRPTGLTFHNPALSTKGYTLISPPGRTHYLLDMAGRIVHSWTTAVVRGGYARLLPNGRLLLGGTDLQPPGEPLPFDGPPPDFLTNIRRMGAHKTTLLELDWDGNVLWEYRNPAIHHDFVRLPNGNTIIPEWVEVPADIAKRVRGGTLRPKEKLPPLVGDDFVEIDPAGKEVARTHLWELLDPVKDPICPLDNRLEWTHVNSVDLTREGHLVFSARANSRVGIIDRAANKLLWKYGAPETHHQHHATVLPNGNIQIFDNGMHQMGLPWSRVIEVNPKDDAKPVWQYTADPPEQFFSGHISGAERLPGGNVLICEGAAGRIFEITPRGEVVWEWVTPFATRTPARNMIWIFRAHRYLPDFSGLAGRELDPVKHAQENRLVGLM